MTEAHSNTAPSAAAPDFSAMDRAPADIPWWYWNRHSLRKLREAVDTGLRNCGFAPGASVLELGCGNRAYQRAVERAGYQYIGADLGDNAHADVVIAPNGIVPVPDQSYDAVLSIQVLEHVPDPVAYLTEARRLLKPGGRLVLSTHGFWAYHPSPTDYWRWTNAGLRKLLQDNGYKVISFTGVMGMVPAALQMIQDHLRRKLPTPLMRVFCAFMQTLVAWTDHMHADAARSHDAMIYVVVLEAKH